MNKNEINTTLEEFCRKYLSPSSDERTSISKLYKQLQDILPGNEIFQSGSYKRETAVTPVHDLDVIWVLPESLQVSGEELFSRISQVEPFYFDVKKPLESLASVLTDGYRKVGMDIKIDLSQTHSVNISFPKEKDFSVDVVPALRSGRKNKYGDDVYLVPEIQKFSRGRRVEMYKAYGEKIPWILSDPKGYTSQSLELNSNLSYRKTVKFAKVWKKSCNASLIDFELKSFHLELIVVDIFLRNKSINFFDAICLFFSNLDTWLAAPTIPDMADCNMFVDSYLNDDVAGLQRERAINFASKTLDRLQSMLLKNNIDELYLLLRESLISTPPWGANSSARKLEITCQIERREKDKFRNSTNLKRIKSNLPSYALQAINGPKPMISGEYIGKEYFLLFTPLIDGLEYDDIRWLVVNNGIEALDIARIGGWRGNEFHFCEKDSISREEHTEYPGMHWIECYVIKEGVCVGSGKFYVGIRSD